MTLHNKELILGVTGSIAAYKAVYLLRELTRAGAQVTVVPTAHAQRFVGPLTFRTLSGRPVLTDLFDPQSAAAVEHVALAEQAAAVDRGARHRQSPGQGRPRHRRRFPHHAAPRRPRPGADGARHGRRHVGAPAVAANVARSASAGSSCSSRTRARSRPGSGPRPAARGRRGRRGARAPPDPAARPGRRAGAGDVGPDARAHRSGALHLEPVVREDGPGGRDGGLRRGAEVILISGPTTLTPARGRGVRAGADRGGHAGGGAAAPRARHHRHQGGRGGRLPRQATERDQDQVAQGRGAHPRSRPQPRHLEGAGRARKGRAFLVGFAAETNDVRPTRRPSSRPRAWISSWPTTSARRASASTPRTTRSPCSIAGAASPSCRKMQKVRGC